MTGLEKIIEDIREESSQTVNAVLDDAKQKAAQIRKEAEKRVQAENAEAEKEMQRQAADLASRAEFSAALRQKQQLLAARQELIAEVMKKALTEAENMPADRYFHTVIQMAVHAAHTGSGVLLLNKKDLRRMPADFAASLQAALPAGTSLQVSDQAADIRSGMLLKYGDIEENCSFDAVLAARHDEIQDKVRAVMFERGN